MSLPRANYDPRRVCLNPFPNFTLPFTKHRRTIGVYLAGGLVSLRTPRPPPVLLLCLCLCSPRACPHHRRRTHASDPPSLLLPSPPPRQFALAIWTFLDAAVLSAHARPPAGEPDRPAPVHVAFVDWVPGLCSLLGMLVINVIDKDRVRGEDVGYGDAGAVWRARAVLFVGFALMAGGLAGSVVRCCFFF